MKILKNTIVLAISIFLLLITFPISTYDAAELRYGRTVLGQMNNSQNLLAVYDCLVNGCEKATETIDIQNNISEAELSCVYRVFNADYPEYFWVQGGYSYTKENDVIISVTPTYTFTGSSLETAKSAFEKKVNQLIQGLNGKSDYEKSLILHDRLADTAEYIRTNNDQNAYGALVEGKAVCAGYSKAYQHLLHKVGIPAWCVMGTSINPATQLEESHEWNLVSIDGKWYYTDVTWDDQSEYRFYVYFNMNSTQMGGNHKIANYEEYQFLPSATSTDANYFVKNSLIYSDLDLDKLAQSLKNSNNKTRLYINGDISTFQNNLSNNFFTLMKKMGIPDDYGYSYSTINLDREIILSVSIIDPNHQHSLTFVSAKAPSCSKKGTIAYYTCDCGQWFSDSSALTQITDIQSVVIAAVAHTPSDWKSDSNNHWKICTNCSAEIANSLQPHTTADKNNCCHICSASLSTTKTEPTVNNVDSNSETKQNTGSKNNTSLQNSNTETAQSETSSKDENTTGENTSSVIEDTTPKEQSKPEKTDNNIIYIAIPVGIVTVGGIISVIIFLIKHGIIPVKKH